MRPGRNPRRAYNKDGSEIRPPTVADSLANGEKRITIHCASRSCLHSGHVWLADLPRDLFIPDIALKVVCSACGGREVMTMIHVGDLYERTGADREARKSAKRAGG